MNVTMEKTELIRVLDLQGHDEGGYFRQIHQSEWTVDCPDRAGSTRYGLNTIYYLLTDDSPVGHLHLNQSDIVHFFHAGGPIAYILLHPGGRLERRVMGPDLAQGQVLQMTVPGGVWKASTLLEGSYGLISEAVAPGFDYRDRELATPEQIQTDFPELWDALQPYVFQHAGL